MDTDWEYFKLSWESYKRAMGLQGQPISNQLWLCDAPSLRKKVFNIGSRPTDKETTILENIKQLAIWQHNNMINIANLQTIVQEGEESIIQFAAQINGAANICNFTVLCNCHK